MKKGAEKKAYAVVNWIKKHLPAILMIVFSCVIVLDVANYLFNPIAKTPALIETQSTDMSSANIPSGDMSDFSGQTMPDTAPSDGNSTDGTTSDSDSQTTDGESSDATNATTENSESSDTTTDSAASGEMPSMPSGMTPPGSASSDSTSTDTDTTTAIPEMPSNTDSTSNNLFFNALILLRRAWLPVLIVFSAADAFVIILFARKKRKESRERKAAEEKARKEALLAEVVPEEEMVQPEKKRRGFWVAPCCLFVAIAVVVAMLPSGSAGSTMTVNEEVVESTAEKNTISTVLSGTGTLTDSDAVEVTVPDSVDVISYLVSNGDTVAAGDALATVDTTSVEAAIVELQDVIDELDADLVEEGEKSAESTVTATAAGKVKYIYAEAGTSVADTVYANGALVLLSLDGLMAVDIETTAVSVGDSVTVTLSDGSAEKGTVSQISEGKATVTLSDDAAYQDSVSVSASDGTVLGSGTLYINSELKVLAYNGTVKSLSVSVGDSVDAGDTLMTLTDVGHTATYQAMVTRRSELEEQMEELFKLTQDGTVYAETAGIVSGVSDDLLATSSDGSGSLLQLSNEPDNAYSDDSSLINYCATVSSVSGSTLTLKVSSVVYSGVDYTDLSELSFSNLKNELTLNYTDSVWVYENGWSKSLPVTDLKTGDKLVLTYRSGETDADSIIWMVYAGSADDSTSGNDGNSTENSGGQPGQDTGGNNGSGGSGDSGLDDGSGESGQTDGEDSDFLNGQDALQGNVTDNAGSRMGGTDALSSALASAISGTDTGTQTTSEETAVYEQYSISEKTICAVTPQDEMTITISVDELDIMSLENGQEAQITLDAISGQSFTGTVTQIELVGTNEGGNTKYSVRVTLSRTDEMLAGMNASVKITTATSDSVTTVPAEALVEQDGKTYVYTSYEKGSDTLGGLVEVETGLSDGSIVEIVSGLEEGDSCFYKYADTVIYNFLAGKK